MHKCNMSFIFHFYTLGLTCWIWTNPSTETLKFESPSNETQMRNSILNTDIDIFRFFSIKLDIFPKLSYNCLVKFLEVLNFFSNSIGSTATSSRFSPFLARKLVGKILTKKKLLPWCTGSKCVSGPCMCCNWDCVSSWYVNSFDYNIVTMWCPIVQFESM